MSANGLDRALKFTLKWEGGFVNHPFDPGGATNRGITQSVYDTYRRSLKQAPRPVSQITDTELYAIYQKKYWNLLGCEGMPWPLDLAVFDVAVNHGPGRAKEFIKKAKANMDDDPKNDTMELARRVVDLRVNFYYGIVQRKASQKVFLNGWLNRARDLKKTIGY